MRSAGVWGSAVFTLGMTLCAVSGVEDAQAAHEWRAAWAAPQPFAVGARLTKVSDRGLRAEAAVARPYGIPGITFDSAFIRSRGGRWEAHAGGLRAPHYREWHAGVARRLQLRPGAELLCGLRLFSIVVAGEALAPRVALTLLAEVVPQRVRFLFVEAGVVDLGATTGERQAATLLVTRASVSGGTRRLVIEHTVSPEGSVETVLGLGFAVGPLWATQAFRCGVGEAKLSLSCRSGPWEASLSQCWHPELGWTPHASICWLDVHGVDTE